MKLKCILLIVTSVFLSSLNNSFGQWTVYDCSVLPVDADPAWILLDGDGGAAEIVDDPLITGNKLLKIEDLVGDLLTSYRFNFDPVQNLTVLFRAKPSKGLLDSITINPEFEGQFFEFSTRSTVYREHLRYETDDDLYLMRNLENGLETTTTQRDHEWVIYRITMAGPLVNVYIYENPQPLLSGDKPLEGGGANLRFGDFGDKISGGLFDWIIWDISGAYAPGEGSPLPDTLTGLGESGDGFGVTFTVTDGNNPLEGASVIFNGDTLLTGLNGTAVFNDVEPGTWLVYIVNIDGYTDQVGIVDVIDADVELTVPMIGVGIHGKSVSIDKRLLNLYPNPISSHVKINYIVERPSVNAIVIYDITGKVVSNVVTALEQPGIYEFDLNTEDLSSGIYFCILKSDNQIRGVQKMVKD